MGASVQAGFPSPADDWVEGPLDLNKHLIEHPAATFFARVQGDSMIGDGVHEGDLLVVDRAVEARNGDMVVCVVHGDFTLKRLCIDNGTVRLLSANHDYPALTIGPSDEFEVWGVARYVIHPV